MWNFEANFVFQEYFTHNNVLYYSTEIISGNVILSGNHTLFIEMNRSTFYNNVFIKKLQPSYTELHRFVTHVEIPLKVQAVYKGRGNSNKKLTRSWHRSWELNDKKGTFSWIDCPCGKDVHPVYRFDDIVPDPIPKTAYRLSAQVHTNESILLSMVCIQFLGH